MAKNFSPRQRFFSAVIVRGEEKEGVKVWGYGKNAYQDLINLVCNDEYGDITDVDNGTDLGVMASKAAGQQFAMTKLTPARKTSPLSKNKQEAEEFMESIPDFEDLHKEPTLKEVTQALEEYLNGGSSTDEEAEADSSETVKYGAKGAASDPVEDAFKSIGL
jgi:hypothetical protein